MNKLQIAQRLAKEADISGAANGTLPASTIGQTGEMLSVVQWVNDYYENIQSEHDNWHFLRNDFTFDTLSGTAAYTPTDAGLAEHNTWLNTCEDDYFTSYLTSAGTADEQNMEFVPWDDYKNTYGFASSRTQTGRPYIYTIKPDKSLVFFPIPDDVYTIGGEYFKRPQLLSADGSEPIFPRQFHMAIVWGALMLYGGFETASATYAHAQREHNRIMGKLYQDQLPAVTADGSL